MTIYESPKQLSDKHPYVYIANADYTKLLDDRGQQQ